VDSDLELANLRVEVLAGLLQEVPLSGKFLLPGLQVRRGLREIEGLRAQGVPLLLHLGLPH